MGGELAKRIDADITLLHVIEKPVSVYEIETTKEILEEWGIDFSAIICLKKAKEILEKTGYKSITKDKKEEIAHEIKPGVYEILEEEKKRKLSIKVREGKLYEEILKECEDVEYDFLFVGKSRDIGLKRKIFKSRSENIAKNIKKPVFIISKKAVVEKVGIDKEVEESGKAFADKIGAEAFTEDIEHLLNNYHEYDMIITKKRNIRDFEEKTDANILVF